MFARNLASERVPIPVRGMFVATLRDRVRWACLKHDLRRLRAREKDNSDVLAQLRGG